jgi:hypothetical protein
MPSDHTTSKQRKRHRGRAVMKRRLSMRWAILTALAMCFPVFSLPAWSAQAISIPGPGQGYQITKNDSGPKNGMERSNFAAGCFWHSTITACLASRRKICTASNSW